LLGPSILIAGPPFSAGYALHACRSAKAKFAARFGLAMALLELLILAALLAMESYLMWVENS
jgi:hypothetical protein